MDSKSLDEIESDLVRLAGEISKHENKLSTSGYRSLVFYDRSRYAGCLAERTFLLDLKNRVLCRERKLDDSGS